MPRCEQCQRDFATEEGLKQHNMDKHGIGKVTAHEMKEQKRQEREQVREQEMGKQRRGKRAKTLGIIAVVVIVLAGIGYLVSNLPQNETGRINLNVPSYVPFRGADSAAVNVVEFGDYQCPVCKDFFLNAEPQIKSNYEGTGKVRFYFIDLSFLGPDSVTLAQGAWCADEQGLYYEYHDYIYSNQGAENTGWGSPDKVKAMAANIPGLDTASFASCLDSNKYRSRLTQNTQLGQQAGVRATPSVLIGSPARGYTLIVGSRPFATYQQAIEKELANVTA